LGTAQRVGLGSGTATLASTSFGGVGKATSVGALSVPSTWAGAAPAAGPAVATPFTGTGALPAAHAGASTGMPPMMPVTNLGGGDGSAAPSRFDLRSTVIPLSPAAG
jgi:PPE-repeat protein